MFLFIRPKEVDDLKNKSEQIGLQLVFLNPFYGGFFCV